MSTALLLLLGIMLLAALALVLLPLGAPVHDTYAEARASLEAERDQLYAELRDLSAPKDDQMAEHWEEYDRARTALELRAAVTLRRLDELPAAPPPSSHLGQATRLARFGWGAALTLTVLGALTLIPQWQRLGIGAAEAQQVTAAQQLPRLRATAQKAPSPAAYNAWGDAAFEQSNYPEALRAYTESLKLEPRQPQPLRRLGTLLLNRESMGGQPLGEQEAGQAFALIQTAAALAPDEAESQLLLGYALVKFGEDERALTALERYRELNPQGRDADELIGSIRNAQNSASPALALYSASCASCHGPAGNGALGPSLRSSALTRDAAATIITQGRGSMPAFSGLSQTELAALLDLLQEWQQDTPAKAIGATESPARSTVNESAGSLSGNGLNTTNTTAPADTDMEKQP